MREIPARQVHLDFHTSPLIKDVGKHFEKKQFQKALKLGHVNSVTIFAKCHHGYSYYPTRIGTQSPALEGFDLTAAMMDAAHEIGVAAPVYITAGWSAKDAAEHPEWHEKDINGQDRTTNFDLNAAPEDPKPRCSWQNLCLNGPYADYIFSITQEIVDRYDALDGLFYDICFLNKTCYCEACLKGMKEEGFNLEVLSDAEEYYRRHRMLFMQKNADILHAKFPEATVFYNGGADIYKPEYLPLQSHLEMEDLPTTWGGYNKMPPRASFMHRTGKEIVGMTGKFHTDWGEFGGYKNPRALEYEVMMMAMNGAKCSIGDQMPPCGRMDEETYKGIGQAYSRLEKLERWAYPSESTADLGVYLSGDSDADTGLHTMLLEAHLDFDVVMPGDDLSPFRLLILPDCVRIDEQEAERIRQFAGNGGKVIFGYQSAVQDGKLLLDPGAELVNEPVFDIDYLCPTEELKLPFGNAPFLCYQSAMQLKVTDGRILADLYDPYFSRTYGHYCSHQNTPYTIEKSGKPAMVIRENIAYYAHPLCGMYRRDGAQLFREALIGLIRILYRPKYEVNLPSGGRSALRFQKDAGRYVLHTAYAAPIRRGRTEVIEDIVPLTKVKVKMKLAEEPEKVRLVPQKKKMKYTWKKGVLSFIIPKIELYQAVEIQLKKK